MIWGICPSSNVFLQPVIASQCLAFPNPHQLMKSSLQDHSCSPQKLHQSHLYIPHMDTALSFLQIRAWLWLPISPSNPQRAKQASQLCQFAFSHAGIMLPFTGAPLPSWDTEKSKRIFVPRWQKSPELNQSRSLQIPIPASRERRATPWAKNLYQNSLPVKPHAEPSPKVHQHVGCSGTPSPSARPAPALTATCHCREGHCPRCPRSLWSHSKGGPSLLHSGSSCCCCTPVFQNTNTQ